jgi:8-oxo-dGTP pyrophosphatase MutT (NUDIX family)
MNDGEHAEIAARREFLEEIGSDQTGPLEPLGDIRLRERGLRPPGRQGQARWAKNAGRAPARTTPRFWHVTAQPPLIAAWLVGFMRTRMPRKEQAMKTDGKRSAR